MNYLAALRFFARSADLGSFSKAASEGSVKVSTVSRYVADLEHDLGAALFNRSTHGLHLTQIGKTFHDDVVRILGDLEEARSRAISSNTKPQGRLRVTVPNAFGRMHVVPALPDFMAAFPDIETELTFADSHLDLIEAGMDLAIRIGAMPDSALVASRLASHRRVLCASPSRVAVEGAPKRPEDLGRMEALVFSLQPTRTWHFRHRASDERVVVEVTGRMRANDTEALLSCALQGMGVALLPIWAVHAELRCGRLVGLLDEWEAGITPDPERAIWVVYPPKRIVAPKVRAFTSFLRQRFKDQEFLGADTR